VDDARPDRWGEQVIRFIDKPPRLSLLQFLFFAGDERSARSASRRPQGAPSVRSEHRSRTCSHYVLFLQCRCAYAFDDLIPPGNRRYFSRRNQDHAGRIDVKAG
jgi:hypothetical protein